MASFPLGGSPMAAAAMATLVATAVRSLASNLRLTEPRRVLVEGADWKALVVPLGPGFSLLGVLDGAADPEPLERPLEEGAKELLAALRETQRVANGP